MLVIAVSATLGYVFRDQITQLLQQPLGKPLFYSSPAGSFNFVMKISFMLGAFVALPVLVYQLIRFVEPALPVPIKKSLITKIVGASFGLALVGSAFGFYVIIPQSLHFFFGYSNNTIQPLISATEYLSYVTNILLTFALMFQIPLIILFINRIKPIKPGKLLKYQRHVIVAAFLIAVLLPFTYDPITQFIIAVPIVFLYYFSVFLLWTTNRRFKSKSVAIPETFQPPVTTPLKPPIIPLQATPRRFLAIDGFVHSSGPLVNSHQTTQAVSTPTLIDTGALPQKIKSLPGRRPVLAIDGISRPLASAG